MIMEVRGWGGAVVMGGGRCVCVSCLLEGGPPSGQLTHCGIPDHPAVLGSRVSSLFKVCSYISAVCTSETSLLN